MPGPPSLVALPGPTGLPAVQQVSLQASVCSLPSGREQAIRAGLADDKSAGAACLPLAVVSSSTAWPRSRGISGLSSKTSRWSRTN